MPGFQFRRMLEPLDESEEMSQSLLLPSLPKPFAAAPTRETRYRDDMTGGGPRVIETQSIRQPESDGFYEHAQEHFSEHAQEHL